MTGGRGRVRLAARGTQRQRFLGLDFRLPPELEARRPPEARGLGRDEVRLMISYLEDGEIAHGSFRDLATLLNPDDLVVVNTSGTVPAALPAINGDGIRVALHLSTRLPSGLWIVELRRLSGASTSRFEGDVAGEVLDLPAGGRAFVLEPYGSPGRRATHRNANRLWIAALRLPRPWRDFLLEHGAPIRYDYVDGDWPLEYYQTVFADEPGSAEMPSAGRPFTAELLDRLQANGVRLAPLLLHAGVASLEDDEVPAEEFYRVPAETAEAVTATRRTGGRVIAVGTTVVRALETMADADGSVRAGEGWTSLIMTPERRFHAATALLTGFHEPRASHFAILEALAGREHLKRAYGEALRHRYLWHEFGDVHLILPGRRKRQARRGAGSRVDENVHRAPLAAQDRLDGVVHPLEREPMRDELPGIQPPRVDQPDQFPLVAPDHASEAAHDILVLHDPEVGELERHAVPSDEHGRRALAHAEDSLGRDIGPERNEVNDTVSASAARQRHEPLGQLLGALPPRRKLARRHDVDRHSGQLRQPVEVLSAASDRDQARNAEQRRAGDRRRPRAPGGASHDRGVAERRPRQLQRAERARERWDPCRDIERKLVGKRLHVRRRRANILGQAAVAIAPIPVEPVLAVVGVPDRAEGGAERLAITAAEEAVAARERRVNENPLALAELANGAPGLRNRPSDLMPEDGGQELHEAGEVPDAEQAACEAGRPDANQHVVVSDTRNLDLLEPEALLALICAGSEHCLLHSARSSVAGFPAISDAACSRSRACTLVDAPVHRARRRSRPREEG
jgi:S-adenosylmethionine:tRNA ribosyltransferase-isomerase